MTVCAVLVPTAWLPNVTVVELNEKPAVETETSAVLPPPPQDVDHRAIAMQAVARITAVPRSGSNAPVFIPGSSVARVLPKSSRFPSPGDRDKTLRLPSSAEESSGCVWYSGCRVPLPGCLSHQRDYHGPGAFGSSPLSVGDGGPASALREGRRRRSFCGAPSTPPRSETCELMHGVRHWTTDCSVSCMKRHPRSEGGWSSK